MRVVRFFLVLLLFTVATGAFGALVGGLVGYALPRSLPVFVSTQTRDGPGEAEDSERSRTAEFGIGRPNAEQTPTSGAAVGAAAGLLLGGVLGMPFAILDQLLLAWRSRRKEPEPLPRG